MEILEHREVVPLWAHWSVALPPATHQRNEDGSWSAWGVDWSVDVHIIEMAGDSTGKPISAETLHRAGKRQTDFATEIEGHRWIGYFETIEEEQDGKAIYRFAGRLCATNTVMSCWISCLQRNQSEFAQNLLECVVHDSQEIKQARKPKWKFW